MKRSAMAVLLGAAAVGMATLGLAPAAEAHPNHGSYDHGRYDYRPYPDFDYRARQPMSRHEAQHDTNRNGRLDPWEHESLHRHEQEARRPAYPYQRPYVRRYPARPAFSWSWRLGW